MWISRKQYNYLKEKAEINIDVERQILTAQENVRRGVARAMEEYSTVLEERDELRLRVIELRHDLDAVSKKKDLRNIEEVIYHNLKVYFDGASSFMKYLIEYCNGAAIYPSEMEKALIEFIKQYGEIKEVSNETIL